MAKSYISQSARDDGLETLRKIGASWFVSYCYYNKISKKHLDWKKVAESLDLRVSYFTRTEKYHKYWLVEVLKMKDANLNRNSLGLRSHEIKRMAKEILDKM